MYKLIFFFGLVAMTQCKTNQTIAGLNDPIMTTLDTTILEKMSIYRGDTLTTYITMVGDTIIAKRTTKYGSSDEVDMIASTRHMKRSSARGDVSEVMMMESRPATEGGATIPAPPRGRIKPDMPQNPNAGQLTAGEWNDLNNWEDWEELLNDNEYFSLQDHWGIYPNERYSVFVTNDQNIPLSDIRIDLKDGNKTIWSARTDHSGRAELWSNLINKGERYKSALKAIVYHKGNTINLNVNKGKSTHLKISNSCNAASAVDIMFVVDATGSMGDEINYLKSEVKDVIKRSIQSQSDLDLRVGSVFYRDANDSYLTTVSPLTSDLEKVYQFIGEQSAAGGGDYPEAVDAALEEALAQPWSSKAVSRIVFLLLDAPPHGEDQIKSTIRDQIAEAAEKGIKIIPISASGINRETEFLLKFMSIATNGTYVFITDDSGIGGEHLDPLVADFEVEKLNDLMVRIIENYTTIKSCDEKISTNQEVKIYPNPTSNFIHVEVPEGVNMIKLISSSGKVMYSIQSSGDEIKVDLSQYVDGMYTVQCIGGDFIYSYPVIKVSE